MILIFAISSLSVCPLSTSIFSKMTAMAIILAFRSFLTLLIDNLNYLKMPLLRKEMILYLKLQEMGPFWMFFILLPVWTGLISRFPSCHSNWKPVYLLFSEVEDLLHFWLHHHLYPPFLSSHSHLTATSLQFFCYSFQKIPQVLAFTLQEV